MALTKQIMTAPSPGRSQYRTDFYIGNSLTRPLNHLLLPDEYLPVPRPPKGILLASSSRRTATEIMATVFAQPHALHNARNTHQHVQQQAAVQQPQPQQQRKPISKQRFLAEFSQCLFDFVIQLLPTPEELAIKEDVRKLLERLIRTLEPDSRLLSFGSTANGFSLRNSGALLSSEVHNIERGLRDCADMDLCCLIDSEERLSASDLVTMLGDLLERGQYTLPPPSRSNRDVQQRVVL